MSLLQTTINKIQPLNEEIMDKVQIRLDKLSKFHGGAGGLGRLQNMVKQYAGITETLLPPIPRKCMVLMAADHGVSKRGVSAYPVETTVQMTKNYLLAKGAGANAMAKFCQADMVVVDVGIAADMSDTPGLLNRKIAYGTQDFTEGPAMTRQQAIQALEIGIAVVNEQINKGYRCFSLGEMGIGNTTSSAAIMAAFAKITPEKATGRGTGISDNRLQIKIEVVRKGLLVNQPNTADSIDVLAKIGGFEIGALAGAILAAAASHCVVVIDGFNASAAGLLAHALQPLCRHYMMGSHLSAEPAHAHMLKLLQLEAYIDMGLRLGEASGAALGMDLLDVSIKMLQSCTKKKPSQEEFF